MWAAIAVVAASVIGNIMSSGDRNNAKDMAAKAYEEVSKLGLPPDLSRALILKQFKEGGILTPENEMEVDAGISKVAEIEEDSKLKDAQMNALQILQQKGRTGLGPEDRAALNQVRDEIQRDQEGKRQQILQGMQQRGMGGSGAELIAQLQQSQSSANQASMEGDRLAAEASKRALDSLTRSGQLAGDIRQQDFSVEEAKAKAADELQRFNVSNQIARQSRNVSSRNTAAAANLGRKQQVSDANMNQYNAELNRQNEAKRDYWQDLRDRAAMRANAAAGQATNFQAAARDTASQYAGAGAGIGTAIGAYSNYQAKKEANNNKD